MRFLIISVIALLALAGCTGTPDGIEPVSGFEEQRYLGTWYEIARLDHSFEEDLSQVTARYSANDDGSIRVINRGYNDETGEWEEAEGRAVFVDDRDLAHLKVSFFGPFYASYVVFELDQADYSYAYVTGYDRDYLWFLSRTPEVSDQALEDFRTRAREEGFDLDELIIVDQSKNR
ncbi:MAG: lipocalin family protein [Marinobacter sp.]